MIKLHYRELRPADWPLIERLFGASGACGGCWCMWWRVERGGKLWEATKGAAARRSFRELVESGKARGILALEGEEPVGWCAFGPRADFPRLDTVKAYARPDDQAVWSVNCFFVPRAQRGRGIARGLLDAALAAMRKRKVKLVEAYPVTTTQDGRRVSSAFAFTGPLPLFEAAGFEVVQSATPWKPLVRRRL